MRQPYIVGRYAYSDGTRGIAAVRPIDLDTLPPTMREIVHIRATNKREAIRIFRATAARIAL